MPKYTKPFLKWVGGKTQIIDEIIKTIPKEMNNYHEVFVGGGSVLLAFLTLVKENQINVKEIYAYDLNKYLIEVYQNIQQNKEKLLTKIIQIKEQYHAIKELKGLKNPVNEIEAKTSKESYYYWLRKQFNTTDNSILRSALFICINKLCFRGIYREGPNGFNVPFGHPKNTPTIITKNELYHISDLIKNVKFKCCDFSEAFKNIKENDYVYLDPPYVPKNNTTFVSYTKDKFSMLQHKKLFELINALNNVKITLSNSNCKLVTDMFSNFNIKVINCRRAIHSKNPETKELEVIITN